MKKLMLSLADNEEAMRSTPRPGGPQCGHVVASTRTLSRQSGQLMCFGRPRASAAIAVTAATIRATIRHNDQRAWLSLRQESKPSFWLASLESSARKSRQQKSGGFWSEPALRLCRPFAVRATAGPLREIYDFEDGSWLVPRLITRAQNLRICYRPGSDASARVCRII